MRRRLAALTIASCLALTPACGPVDSGMRVVTTGLENPYEIIWGPDDHLWVTEKSGKRVVRVDPETGRKTTALTIRDAVHTEGGQDGVLGLALHPDLLNGSDQVFLSHTYRGPSGNRTKIVRYSYDPVRRRLHSPIDLITDLPSSYDHQGARLRFGPDGKLYYTIGDQGANQFALSCEENHAQTLPTARQVRERDWNAYRGKVLRLETDGSIPRDNPELNGVRSHVYSYGHRNPQGLDFSPQGKLYSSEQGPKSDDEINIIRAGGNYGWPHVAGHRDDRAYVYANWSAADDCPSLTYESYRIPEEVPRSAETEWSHPAFVPPIATFYTVDDGHDFRDAKCSAAPFICWPTIAPAGLEVHDGALLVPSLKDGTVYRLRLSADGERVTEVTPLFTTTNRYRDTAVSPDGTTVFVATDSRGVTRAPSGAPTRTLEHPGAILAFRYEP